LRESDKALIELCARTVEAERLADEDVEYDRAHGDAESCEAYNLAIKHAAEAVRSLLTQTLSFKDGEWRMWR
jgi:hypothetical protein